jgi:hypothetical protein
MRFCLFVQGTLAVLVAAAPQLGQSTAQPPLPAQTLSISLGGDPNGSPFTFRFSRPVPMDRCSITTLQTGEFGGLTMPEYLLPATGTVHVMRTGSGGKPARTLKAAVWCPGFASATVDIRDLATAPPEAGIALVPLRNLTINGTVAPGDDGVSLAGAELHAWYEALWASAFFGQTDGMLPQWKVAQSRIAADGAFRVDVPDFMNDRTVAGFRYPGSFRFSVSRSAPPHDYRLEPRSVAVAASYPALRLRARR